MDWESIPLISDLVKALIVYSPRVFLALITLFLGWVIGRLVGILINSVVGKMRLETVFRRTSVGRAILRSGYTPSRFFVALGKTAIYLFATFSALNFLSIPLLTDSVQALISYIPSFLGGVMILVAGFVFADWIGEAVEKGWTSSNIQSSFLGVIVRLLLYFMTLTIALAQMKIDVTILYIFAQAIAWSIAMAIGIAFGWNLKDRIGPWLDKVLDRGGKTESAT
ncbi:MAG: hypothetical protein V1850_05590 [Candidatus Bathyarchaeota archaeon]